MAVTPDARFKSAHKHLDVFAESWKAEHHEAMALYDFQEYLAEGLSLYDWLTERSKDFRMLVFTGLIPADPMAIQNEKRMFERWLDTAAECERTLASFEVRFGTVEGADPFRAAVTEVRRFIREWRPPVVSQARGLRARRLTEVEAAARQALVGARNTATTP